LTADRQYTEGFEDGFKSGVESAYEKAQAETWDQAFSAGYRACQEELIAKQ
jgi:flagellar biosynthesis/type III secretory pathway protein FliH